jgi:hypothetical protein
MNTPLDAELATVLARLRSGHDVLPFMDRLLPSASVRLAPLPDEMMQQLRTSPDFQRIRPGAPVWIAMSAPPDASAEIIIYRTEADGGHYVVAPGSG